MRELLLRIRVLLVLGVLVTLALWTMLEDRRSVASGGRDGTLASGILLEVAAPVAKLVAWPVSASRRAWGRYVALVDLQSENQGLRQRIAELEDENLQYREALVASGRLARIAAMRDQFETPMLPAEVVGQDLSPWFRSVLVDRGNADGARSGMPLVTDRGVAGVMRATSPHAGRGMLLLDRQSAIDGIVQRSRARGIIRGTGAGELEFVFMVRGDDVRVGDVVISSGLGGVYPKGLRIGRVESVQTEKTRLLHTARIKPAVDFGRLEQVFVMLWRGPGIELLYEGEGDEVVAVEVESGATP